ncbi:MAG: DUF4783 domain-containing protein [Niabella sp.]
MKSLLSILFFIVGVFTSSLVFAQSIDGVVNGLKNGNATQITDNAGDNFSLTVLDKSNSYSKVQAQQIIKDFFSKNAVKGFDLKHKGNSPNGQYAIGTLSTSGGNYRVNIFMKKEGAKEVIKELRFQLIE